MFPCQDFSLSAMRIGCIYTWNKDLIETCKYMLCFQQAAAYIQQLMAKMIRDKGEMQLQKTLVCPGLLFCRGIIVYLVCWVADMVPKWLKTGWFYGLKMTQNRLILPASWGFAWGAVSPKAFPWARKWKRLTIIVCDGLCSGLTILKRKLGLCGRAQVLLFVCLCQIQKHRHWQAYFQHSTTCTQA